MKTSPQAAHGSARRKRVGIAGFGGTGVYMRDDIVRIADRTRFSANDLLTANFIEK